MMADGGRGRDGRRPFLPSPCIIVLSVCVRWSKMIWDWSNARECPTNFVGDVDLQQRFSIMSDETKRETRERYNICVDSLKLC
mmetsp:Transcript_27863/g.63812  ORF Transcript_27863/g.63812 Transcript_27863/m.63812 type:complete len:83 (-) Transcript_27863:142-390(-)